MILSVEELEFLYRNRKILHEVAFSIEEGEVVAILGPNGVGKTTLLKCLNRILRPKGGAVHLDGNNLFDLGTMEIARLIGYVPQRVETGRLTAFDAVLLGRRPHIKWDVTEKDLRIVDSVFRLLSMESNLKTESTIRRSFSVTSHLIWGRLPSRTASKAVSLPVSTRWGTYPIRRAISIVPRSKRLFPSR